MPHIRKVEFQGDDAIFLGGNPNNTTTNINISAEIAFSSIETELGIKYWAHAYLFERDSRRDAYSAFPNHNSFSMHRAGVQDDDDFLAKADPQGIDADPSVQTIEFAFTIPTSRFLVESDRKFEIMPFVAVVPVTASAMKWGREKKFGISL